MPLSLVLPALLALLPAARADGTAVWLRGTPVPLLSPDRSALSAAELAPSAAWTEVDQRAVDHLRAELEAVRPLKDALDGELQILRRLDAALAPVDLVRAEDRDLVFRALALQGYAARRYFQDSLASDEAAAAWRLPLGAGVEVRPWVDAIALDPDRPATAVELPDAPEQIAYQELRARLLLLSPALVTVTGLPPGARLLVDGVEAPADRAQLVPGAHQIALRLGDRLVSRQRVRLEAGQALVLPYLATAEELEALASALAEEPAVLTLPLPVAARLAAVAPPVELLIPGRKEPLRYTVLGNRAVPSAAVTSAATPTAPGARRDKAGPALVLEGALGAGWVYDGDFLLQNLSQGAPDEVATVNALGPFGTLGATGMFGPVALGLGLDGALPLGEHHDLPVGNDRLRLRSYPHLAVGHDLLRLTAGPLFPWHLGLGGRLHLPLPSLRKGPLELVAAGTWGLPLDQEAADGVGRFEPGDLFMAWLGIGARWRSPG